MFSDGDFFNLGVYTPYTQGFYFGELIGQLQNLCHIKRYSFSIIPTGGFGKYNSDLHCNHLDLIVILRNAISIDLAKDLLAKGKTLVSVSYDYFPLDIPVISADNFQGCTLAYDFLKERHENLLFIGDLKHYDIRKRYEAFVENHDSNGIETTENMLIPVDDTLFQGGYDAAEKFIQQNNPATGIICGAGLTAIGFIQQLRKIAPQQEQALEIVAFDSLSLMPVTDCKISIIDPNINLIAYSTIKVAEAKWKKHELVSRWHPIESKLVQRDSEMLDTDDIYIATSTELKELSDPNYQRSINYNFYEWPKEIARSNFDKLMMLAPLFPGYLEYACFSRIIKGENGEDCIRKISSYSISSHEPKHHLNEEASNTETYPQEGENFNPESYKQQIHFPIFVGKKFYALLSIYGNKITAGKLSSLSSLLGYLSITIEVWVSDQLKKHYSKSALQKTNENTRSNNINGNIRWYREENLFVWDNKALAMIGLSNKLEKNIYRNMEIIDRVHEENKQAILQAFKSIDTQSLNLFVKFRHKRHDFISTKISSRVPDRVGVIDITITVLQE